VFAVFAKMMQRS